MARPKGTKYIETPERMYELFDTYRNDVKNSPRHKYELNRNGEPTAIPLEVPLTLEGFETYVAKLGVISDMSNYFANSDNRYSDYSTICSRIRKEIRADQIAGGMVGQYNASITQRLNSLVEKQEHKHDITSFEFGGD
jgi:hypothetical protein